MHHSRLCAVLIDCKTSDVDEAARFWADALGRRGGDEINLRGLIIEGWR
jgi:hypothetical protein